MGKGAIQPTTLADTEKSLCIKGFLEIHFYHTTSQTVFFLPQMLLLEAGPIHPCYLMFLLPVAVIDKKQSLHYLWPDYPSLQDQFSNMLCWEFFHLPSEQSG